MFRWVEHAAELELEIQAPTEGDVFAEALSALAELLGGDAGEGPPASRAVNAQAGDRPALLAAWLEELVFLAESAGFVPAEILALRLTAVSAQATVSGRLGQPPPLVKAVTYHRLTFAPAGQGYRATVVLDV